MSFYQLRIPLSVMLTAAAGSCKMERPGLRLPSLHMQYVCIFLSIAASLPVSETGKL